MDLIDLLLGRPLATEEEKAERIGPAKGIPIFGLDALSSAAYQPVVKVGFLNGALGRTGKSGVDYLETTVRKEIEALRHMTVVQLKQKYVEVFGEESLPGEHSQLVLEFVGLVGLEDPLRATVPAAVSECRTAGIRIVMITGDYPATAQSIARQAGLANPEKINTGPELEAMSDEELAKQIKDVQVFARVVPEQKLRIVMALKANREIVAMTGDGVNDAPALKAAHIGIAMGGRGTDVAREAASLVLLDDELSSIVAAVRLGRRIYDNIKKAIAFTFAVHVPIAGLSMLPVFFSDWPLLLFPVHIVFLELIIDPSCSLIFEAEEAEANVMERPPRSASERLFSFATVGWAVLEGLSVLAACLGVFLLSRGSQQPDAARALTSSPWWYRCWSLSLPIVHGREASSV